MKQIPIESKRYLACVIEDEGGYTLGIRRNIYRTAHTHHQRTRVSEKVHAARGIRRRGFISLRSRARVFKGFVYSIEDFLCWLEREREREDP